MIRFLVVALFLQNIHTVYASRLSDPCQWEPLAGGQLVSMTKEDVPYTKAKLFYMPKFYRGQNASIGHGISSPVGSPVDWDFIEDILTELKVFYGDYVSGLESANFQWQPLVLLEGGVGNGYFANRFRKAFNENFPIKKENDQPPFMTYVLNEPFQGFHQTLDANFQQSPNDILNFKRKSKNIEDHLYNPNNQFKYNFVVMHKVAHFWNPREFAMVFSKLHEKLNLGGKIYLTLDAPELISPQTNYMQDYIRAHQRGDLCPGYFPGKIFNAMHDIDGIFMGGSPDDPEALLQDFIKSYQLNNSIYMHFTESLFDSEALKTSLTRMFFEVDAEKSFNYSCSYDDGQRGSQTCAIATKTVESPDFSGLLEQATHENNRKNPALNTKNLLKALPCFEGFCFELDELARRINRILKDS